MVEIKDFLNILKKYCTAFCIWCKKACPNFPPPKKSVNSPIAMPYNASRANRPEQMVPSQIFAYFILEGQKDSHRMLDRSSLSLGLYYSSFLLLGRKENNCKCRKGCLLNNSVVGLQSWTKPYYTYTQYLTFIVTVYMQQDLAHNLTAVKTSKEGKDDMLKCSQWPSPPCFCPAHDEDPKKLSESCTLKCF